MSTYRIHDRDNVAVAVEDLKAGLSGTLEYDNDPVDIRIQTAVSRSFMGFLRADGKAGTRSILAGLTENPPCRGILG